MLFSRKKQTAAADLGWIGTDLHSHLVPGIDDGSPDMETSLELVRGLAGLGYRRLVTTPHVLSDMYPNTTEIIQDGAAALRQAITDAGIEVELRAAAEYFIDESFDARLRARQPLLTISGNIVLVEFSMITAPMDLQDVLFEMQMQDYQPLIAHPERYVYLSRKKEFFSDLKTSGCQLQLNLLSLAGYYGPQVQELAEYLLKQDLYDYVGTDLHNGRHLEALKKLPAAIIKKIQDGGRIKNADLQ